MQIKMMTLMEDELVKIIEKVSKDFIELEVPLDIFVCVCHMPKIIF